MENNIVFSNRNRRFFSSLGKKLLVLLAVFGPATITAMADNDAGGVATVGDVAPGVPLTSAAFGSAFGWAPYALSVAVILFAFSTMITWSYYGMKGWTYIFGEGKTKELVFKLMFCFFVFVGAVSSLGSVLDFSDAALFAMGVVNVIGLYLLMPIVKRELKSYMDRLKSGEIKAFK